MAYKWYSEISIKTFYADEDGIIYDSSYRSSVVSKDSPTKLTESIEKKAKGIANSNVRYLLDRMDDWYEWILKK